MWKKWFNCILNKYLRNVCARVASNLSCLVASGVWETQYNCTGGIQHANGYHCTSSRCSRSQAAVTTHLSLENASWWNLKIERSSRNDSNICENDITKITSLNRRNDRGSKWRRQDLNLNKCRDPRDTTYLSTAGKGCVTYLSFNDHNWSCVVLCCERTDIWDLSRFELIPPTSMTAGTPPSPWNSQVAELFFKNITFTFTFTFTSSLFDFITHIIFKQLHEVAVQ